MNKKKNDNLIFKIEKELPVLPRVIWTQEHDNQLKLIVEENNGKNWRRIAEQMSKVSHLPNLNAKKCRERWSNCANPKLDKGSFNPAEGLLFLAYHQKYGTKWSLISSNFPNRNSIRIKNEFTNLIRKVIRRIKHYDTDRCNNVLMFVQGLYMTVMISEIVTLNEFPKDYIMASKYMYENAKRNNIKLQDCLNYIIEISHCISQKYKHRLLLKNFEKFKELIPVKFFITRLLFKVRTCVNPSSNLDSTDILNLIESVFTDYETKFKLLFKAENHKVESKPANIMLQNDEEFIPEKFSTNYPDIIPSLTTKFLSPLQHFENDFITSSKWPNYTMLDGIVKEESNFSIENEFENYESFFKYEMNLEDDNINY